MKKKIQDKALAKARAKQIRSLARLCISELDTSGMTDSIYEAVDSMLVEHVVGTIDSVTGSDAVAIAQAMRVDVKITVARS